MWRFIYWGTLTRLINVLSVEQLRKTPVHARRILKFIEACNARSDPNWFSIAPHGS